MSEISVVWEKRKFDSFTGGCYTPPTYAAIDRTLTILVSFPNETSSVLPWSYWKKLPALGGWLVSCHISIQGIRFELHASIEESYEMPKQSLSWCFYYCDKIARNCVVVNTRRVNFTLLVSDKIARNCVVVNTRRVNLTLLVFTTTQLRAILSQ